MSRLLQPIIEQTHLLYADLNPLWSIASGPGTRRALAVVGFCEIVRQHTNSQLLLAQSGFDVSATTLVRPAFEAMVRAMWCMAGADDEWIEKFLVPSPKSISSDAESNMGPNVQRMLDQIKDHHPEHIHSGLVELKARTWRAMHSYVHGGIRPFAQGLMGFREHEVAGVVINANGMLIMATNLVRMACGLSSPQLPDIQRKHAVCLPLASGGGGG